MRHLALCQRRQFRYGASEPCPACVTDGRHRSRLSGSAAGTGDNSLESTILRAVTASLTRDRITACFTGRVCESLSRGQGGSWAGPSLDRRFFIHLVCGCSSRGGRGGEHPPPLS